MGQLKDCFYAMLQTNLKKKKTPKSLSKHRNLKSSDIKVAWNTGKVLSKEGVGGGGVHQHRLIISLKSLRYNFHV